MQKGYRLLDKVYSEERIKKPLLRVKNDFHEVDWNTALDLIAERIEEILKRYNSSAILYYSGDGYEGYLRNIERLFLITWVELHILRVAFVGVLACLHKRQTLEIHFVIHLLICSIPTGLCCGEGMHYGQTYTFIILF